MTLAYIAPPEPPFPHLPGSTRGAGGHGDRSPGRGHRQAACPDAALFPIRLPDREAEVHPSARTGPP